MKKTLKYAITIIIVLTSIVIIDYLNVKHNNTKPIISIKTTKEKERMIIHNAILYRVIECTDEKNNYTIKKYSDKIPKNYCPKTTKIQFINNKYKNSKNVIISKEEYNKLHIIYSSYQIDNMNENEINEALKTINQNINKTKKEN